MKFQFKIQAFQTEAAESVVRVFAGQPNVGASKYRRDIGSEKRLRSVRQAAERPTWFLYSHARWPILPRLSYLLHEKNGRSETYLLHS